MFLTATEAGLIVCTSCGKLFAKEADLDNGRSICSRCNAHLHARIPNSLQRSWALLIAGIMLYFPANLLPIMITEDMGRSEASTILGGVLLLVKYKSYSIALVVFVASILIPLLKFLFIGFLLISLQRKSSGRRLGRLRLYRFIELVGRWSMVDVFVVAILSALIQLKLFIQVFPGKGASAFAAMVVLTMLAARMLDPRMIWDDNR